MCDYSLYAIPNRLALRGEELVVHRFATGSIGLASPGDVLAGERAACQASQPGFWNRLKRMLIPPDPLPIPAVCVPPGARLILKDIPQQIQRQMNSGSEETVTFVQTGLMANQYRDAIRFENGREMGLQALCEGQRVEVLSLESEPRHIPWQEQREPEWIAVLPGR